MSPYLIGGIGVALWFSPALYLLFLWLRRRHEHRPDPVFEDEEVARLEEIWAMPTRNGAL
jgi:hypothetical protein